jgi:general secretion pathway protein G
MNSKAGFTLVELLVVVSVIGLLSSIVLGTVASARQKAAMVKFDAEFRQLRPAVTLYRLDNREYPLSSFLWSRRFSRSRSVFAQ